MYGSATPWPAWSSSTATPCMARRYTHEGKRRRPSTRATTDCSAIRSASRGNANGNGSGTGPVVGEDGARATTTAYDKYVRRHAASVERAASTRHSAYNGSWGYSHSECSAITTSRRASTEGERDAVTGDFVSTSYGEVAGSPRITTSPLTRGLHQQIHHSKAVSDNAFYLGDGTLKAIVGYQQNRRQEYEESGGSTPPGLDMRLHTINYDVRLRFPERNADEWKTTVGAGGMWQYNGEPRRRVSSSPAYAVVRHRRLRHLIVASNSATGR
jgi:hypothetical protein